MQTRVTPCTFLQKDANVYKHVHMTRSIANVQGLHKLTVGIVDQQISMASG